MCLFQGLLPANATRSTDNTFYNFEKLPVVFTAVLREIVKKYCLKPSPTGGPFGLQRTRKRMCRIRGQNGIIEDGWNQGGQVVNWEAGN